MMSIITVMNGFPTTNKHALNTTFSYHRLTAYGTKEPHMPEFISSPIFLIIAAVFAIFIVIGIIKHTFRFVIWIAVIFLVLLGLGIVKQSEILQWFENLREMVG